MLAMRPHCERCAAPLAAEARGVWICSFECTYCAACANDVLCGSCPNCGGLLRERPPRVARIAAAPTDAAASPGNAPARADNQE